MFDTAVAEGAAYQYQDDGIHEKKPVETDTADFELLKCHHCSKHVFAEVGVPFHIGKDGDAGCEREMKRFQDIADIADAMIERGAPVEVHA